MAMEDYKQTIETYQTQIDTMISDWGPLYRRYCSCGDVDVFTDFYNNCSEMQDEIRKRLPADENRAMLIHSLAGLKAAINALMH